MATKTAGGIHSGLPVIPMQRDQPTIDLDILHELGSAYEGGTLREFVVPPSTRSTLVSVKLQIVDRPSQQLQSPTYLATVRRRKAARLVKEIEELEQFA